MANITMVRSSDGMTMTIDVNSPLRTSLKSQGFTEQTTAPINNQNSQTNNHTVKFSAYGYDVYNDASMSIISAPDGSGKQAVKWTNPDGSYVWETIDGPNVQNYAPQYYQGETSNNQNENVINNSYVYSSDKLNSKANNAAVNTLYKAYFGRDATSAELKNWGDNGASNTTVKSLEDFLKSERTKYGVTTPIKTLAEITGQIVQNEQAQKATLTSPDGKYKVEVITGSNDAATLQNKGWTVGATGTNVADLNTALNYTSPTNTSTDNKEATGDKTIYKQGNDLYTKQGDKFYKIPNTDALYDLVANKGYNDTRTALPSGAVIGTSSEAPAETPEDKNIYKQGNDLFIKRGDTFYKIPDTATLKDYVFNKGYIDSRLDLPANAPTTTIGSETAPTAEIPNDLANDPYFMQLDENNKAIVSYYYNTLASQNTAKAQAFTTALDLASKQADPYWKEKLNIVKDELQRTTATTEADLASREKTLMDRQNAINEDLATNKEYLTAEQQAELARQSENYNNDLTTVREQMASSGLSSSSIRNRAENKLATRNADIIGSATRAYEKNIKSTENTATRELASIAQQTADYQRQASEAKTSAARTAEANVGSTALGETSVAPLLLGGISGTMLDSKGTDILTRAKALMNENS